MRNVLAFSLPALALFFCIGAFSSFGHSVENIAPSKALTIANWALLSDASEGHNKPIVILIERSNCSYCKTVTHNYLQPLSLAESYRDKVLFRRVNVDAGRTLIGQDGQSLNSASFCTKFNACFSPTILFLGSNQMEIAPRMVGFTSADYYGFYLEKSISAANDALETQR